MSWVEQSSEQSGLLRGYEWVRVLAGFLLEQQWLSPQLGARVLGLGGALQTLDKQVGQDAGGRQTAASGQTDREQEAKARGCSLTRDRLPLTQIWLAD